ncbi:protease complex subunit PrcB family protein [Brevibacillus laterosporus]|uniref:PrcB C-terminal domain-containing protein n=1 Tax=Brevibacillus laterosporus TaxID=1465 RepID=A0AAP8QDD0_BRELA|nr:protease complex subunit PrcB family protein [Brevibacillus laterosporus]MED1663918.1 protease complex subunit PrcB family protein [Brevibacillus laterosporus]MED1669348.1 protease complex subunit PrcB family protein [Brevibacillus laterosporus]MED1719492.1 protease complex subunit PrcB family protein [Brevibacillus laterosporus]PPA88735.1 hypothetical protein C4A76_07315 [Brevibacillus laterosporus]PPB02023.1 hypothetical protein C4A77_13355 [Brevibacillus laterosporus]
MKQVLAGLLLMGGILVFYVNMTPTVTAQDASLHQNTQQSNQKGVVSMSDFSTAPTPYPTSVDLALANIQEQGGYQLIHENDLTYVAIALGERPTSGYSIKVDNVQQETDGTYVIHVVEERPQKTMLLQVITYPTAVITLPQDAQHVTINYL